MKVLFVANTHMNLYREIQEEMEKQGHIVTVIEDSISPFDPGIHKNLPIPKRIREFIWNYSLSKKWEKIASYNDSFFLGFDCLFVLSGVSVNSELVEILKKKNPSMKSILYTWDPCNSYPFDRLLPLFDKAYTFDYYDAKEDGRWTLFPIYYSLEPQRIEKKYDLFSVGSNRVGRYSFIKKILPQIKEAGLSSYIRIVAPLVKQSAKGRFLSLVFPGKKRNQEEQDSFDFLQGKVDADILLRDIMLRQEYDALSSASRVILDDQKDGQYGLTARFMWALGNHKKVITTNKNVYNYSFVKEDFVAVVDKDNPVLPIDFIKTEINENVWPDISDYRLDNWVRTLLS